MKYAVFILALLAGPMALGADAPAPQPAYTFTAEQVAVIAQLAAEKRAAALQIYNQVNDLIADIQKQTESAKKADGKK